MTSTYFVLLICTTITQSLILKDLKQNALPFTPKDVDKTRNAFDDKRHKVAASLKKEDVTDINSAKNKAKILKAAREKGKDMENGIQVLSMIKEPGEKQRYTLDSLLNILRKSSRRFESSISSSSSETSSSSLEMKNWKEEWKEHWMKKKYEAISMNITNLPKGDTVNMAAARPWGKPCGDPNQHDMPWGSCMLPMECEAEYRIYRGDYFCGRTQFVCCALQLTGYDMYQGFDVSFADSSLETDSEEVRNRIKGSREKKLAKRWRDRRKREKARRRRKKNIKRNIKKIVREIRRILNRSFRNSTTEKKRKTKQLKKFVKMMKKKYKEERKAVKDMHEIQVIQSDTGLLEKLKQIRYLNKEFLKKNATIREIILNSAKNNKAARMFLEAYPELSSTLTTKTPIKTRRRGVKPPKDYLDYDIEYGYLYY